jgi:imidazolonepropionase-like amidohydrolase
VATDARRRVFRPGAAVGLLLFGWAALAAAAPAAEEKPPAPGEEFINRSESQGLGPAAPAPDRRRGEGPFGRLVIRGATLIDGTGAPPVGPVDIVVEGGRIAAVVSVGYPKVPIKESRRPRAGDREIDAHGMYVLPGFINAHAHIATPMHGLAGEVPPAEYVYDLWLGHGITTIREVGSGNGLRWTLREKARSAAGEIAAPRIAAYALFPVDLELPGSITTAAQARRWVNDIADAGADGIKFTGAPPALMKAALEEAARRGLETACHHAQLSVARVDVLDTSGWGLTSMEHWYGLPEALFADRTIQDYPAGYNYNDEQHRFGQAGRLWAQAAAPGTPRWNEVMTTLIERDFVLVPTLTIYEASRDLMRAMRAEWHDEYTHPTLRRWYSPSREAHGAYWFDWTTADEIAWRDNYRRWMAFLDEYKNRGGRVAVGEDAGFIYKLYGFDYIRELELLQEAGFHPLEVVRSATLTGAALLGMEETIGSVEAGKRADLVIVGENPLANFKVLYGTGAIRLDDATGEARRVGGVRWTIVNGVVYDARELLADARGIVAAAKERETNAGEAGPVPEAGGGDD